MGVNSHAIVCVTLKEVPFHMRRIISTDDSDDLIISQLACVHKYHAHVWLVLKMYLQSGEEWGSVTLFVKETNEMCKSSYYKIFEKIQECVYLFLNCLHSRVLISTVLMPQFLKFSYAVSQIHSFSSSEISVLIRKSLAIIFAINIWQRCCKYATDYQNIF